MEAVIQIKYYIKPHWRDDPRSKYLVPNNKHSHWHPQNFVGRCSSEIGEFDITFKTNSIGMVDKERVFQNNNAFRVALIGDSFVEGIQVNMEKRYSDLLEKRMSSFGIDTEILNFGISWFSPSLEITLYKNLVRKFNIDLVIIFIHFSDVTDDWKFRSQIEIGANEEIEIAKNNPLLSQVQSKKVKFLRKSALIRWLYRTWTNYEASNTKGLSLKETFESWFKSKFNKDDIEAIQYSESNIITLVNTIRKTGSKVIMCSVPISQTVMINTDYRNRFVRSEFSKDQIHNTKYYTWLSELTSRLELDYIDLLPSFKKAAASQLNPPLFFPNDGHFTDFGHMIVASVLEKKLNEIISEN